MESRCRFQCYDVVSVEGVEGRFFVTAVDRGEGKVWVRPLADLASLPSWDGNLGLCYPADRVLPFRFDGDTP